MGFDNINDFIISDPREYGIRNGFQKLLDDIEYIEKSQTFNNNNRFILDNIDESDYYNRTCINENSLYKDYFPFDKTSEIVEQEVNRKISLENNQIFKIKKAKKQGRRKLGKIYSNEPRHDKFSKDNIIKKIINHFIQSTLNYINEKYNEFLKNNNRRSQPLLHKIINTTSKFVTKKKISKLFKAKARDLFTMDISKRCSRSNPKDNINRIEKLYSQNEAVEVMEILNKSLSELYGEYMNNKIPKYSFQNDLNLIGDKNDTNYKISYQDKARNLINNKNNNDLFILSRN
jgi:hypothetical protein